MNNLEQPKLKFQSYLVIASLLFGLFFGAGNLIFPVHLGQIAGKTWLLATLGFLSTAVVLPMLAILVLSKTESDSIYDLGQPVGHRFALILLVLVQFTIGPLYAAPRIGTISYAVAVEPLLNKSNGPAGLLIFSAIFFFLAYYFANQASTIIQSVGKIMNPLFLALLGVAFLVAFIKPMSNPNFQPVAPTFMKNAYFGGFLEGYNTMDLLAGLVFGSAIITVVRKLGLKTTKQVQRVTTISGLLGMSLVGLVYIGLILLGAMSLGIMRPTAEGGSAFVVIFQHYFGHFGQWLLAIIVILACLTTAIGLFTAFADDMHRSFPKISYRAWLVMSTFFSFVIANVGLTGLIKWSGPILMLIYPICIVLIFLRLTLAGKPFEIIVLKTALIFTTPIAFFEMIISFPAIISKSPIGLACQKMVSYLPFASFNMSWIVPMLIGIVIGFGLYFAGFGSNKVALAKNKIDE